MALAEVRCYYSRAAVRGSWVVGHHTPTAEGYTEELAAAIHCSDDNLKGNWILVKGQGFSISHPILHRT